MKKVLIILVFMILPISSVLLGQNSGKRYNITGQVTDSNNRPVPGAILLIDDKNTEITTDSRGMYKIRVKANASKIAVFKPMFGHMEKAINGRTVINFSMNGELPPRDMENQNKVDEQKVNLGYGYASEDDLTTTINRIDGSDKKYTTYQNIYEMIQGEVPGVQINGKKIFIQGVNSINATDPLLIINGVVVESIDDISPQMVKSIEVLKGSAASIYGSRGANGVIMITLRGSEKK